MSQQKHFLEKDQFISSLFDNLPYGRIDKQATGIGATTHEINNQNRHSIIVVPTRAIGKLKSAIHGTFYIDGDSKRTEIIEKIKAITNSTDVKAKVLIVADSLDKFIKDYSEEIYNNFFILYDEIDIFQEDSTFRPALQTSINYYFKFPEKSRALMSATIQDFSDPRLKEEPLTEIICNKKLSQLSLINMQGDPSVIISKFIRVRLKNSNLKFFIGLNSFKLIDSVIALLPDDLKKEIAVLCSTSKKEAYTEYYCTIGPDGILPRRINLATSAYYTGIDIAERVYMIAVAHIQQDTTLLTRSRLLQFFGRTRSKDSKYVFLYSTSPKLKTNATKLIEDLRKQADATTIIVEQLEIMPKLSATSSYIKNVKQFLIKASEKNNLPLLRYEDGEYRQNYFIQDYIRIDYLSKNWLYTSPSKTQKSLNKYFESIETSAENLMPNADQQMILTKKNRDDTEFKRENYLQVIKEGASRLNDESTKILQGFISLDYRIINVNQVLSKAQEIIINNIHPKKKLSDLEKQTKLYSEGKSFWELIQTYFKTGEKYTNQQIYDGFVNVFTIHNSTMLLEMDSKNKSTKLFKQIFKTDEKISGGKRYYLIKGIYDEFHPLKLSVREQNNIEVKAKKAKPVNNP